MLRGIVINPWTESIEEKSLDGDLSSMYAALSYDKFLVDCFCVGYSLSNGDTLYVDDEGMLKSGTRSFWFIRQDQPLFGCGLILGSDAYGRSISSKRELWQIRKVVRWSPYVTI